MIIKVLSKILRKIKTNQRGEIKIIASLVNKIVVYLFLGTIIVYLLANRFILTDDLGNQSYGLVIEDGEELFVTMPNENRSQMATIFSGGHYLRTNQYYDENGKMVQKDCYYCWDRGEWPVSEYDVYSVDGRFIISYPE